MNRNVASSRCWFNHYRNKNSVEGNLCGKLPVQLFSDRWEWWKGGASPVRPDEAFALAGVWWSQTWRTATPQRARGATPPEACLPSSPSFDKEAMSGSSASPRRRHRTSRSLASPSAVRNLSCTARRSLDPCGGEPAGTWCGRRASRGPSTGLGTSAVWGGRNMQGSENRRGSSRRTLRPSREWPGGGGRATASWRPRGRTPSRGRCPLASWWWSSAAETRARTWGPRRWDVLPWYPSTEGLPLWRDAPDAGRSRSRKDRRARRSFPTSSARRATATVCLPCRNSTRRLSGNFRTSGQLNSVCTKSFRDCRRRPEIHFIGDNSALTIPSAGRPLLRDSLKKEKMTMKTLRTSTLGLPPPTNRKALLLGTKKRGLPVQATQVSLVVKYLWTNSLSFL